MQPERLSFSQWRQLSAEDPERVVDKLIGQYALLSPESQRAFIASMPQREVLIHNLKRSSKAEEQAFQGIPYMLQDMFDVKGLSTRCGAAFSEPFDALLEDSCLIHQQMSRLGGAFFAKTVPSEFGIGLRGENKTFGDCPHANGLRFVCGGGAGSAVNAVAGGWVPLAFGIDSNAGIRIPAAFHGLYGFRMGNNAYARDGIFPIAPSLESIAWVNAHLDDLLATFEALYPERSEPVKEAPNGYLLQDYARQLSPSSKVGLMSLLRELNIDDEPAINKILSAAFQPSSKSYLTIESRELYSIHQYWIEEYENYYSRDLLLRIEAGKHCSPSESDEASIAQQNLRACLFSFFRDYDYLVLPISPLASPLKTEWDIDLENELLQFNAPASLSFLPALILPYECDEGRYSAAQFIFNPRKLNLVPELIEQVRGYYEG